MSKKDARIELTDTEDKSNDFDTDFLLGCSAVLGLVIADRKDRGHNTDELLNEFSTALCAVADIEKRAARALIVAAILDWVTLFAEEKSYSEEEK